MQYGGDKSRPNVRGRGNRRREHPPAGRLPSKGSSKGCVLCRRRAQCTGPLGSFSLHRGRRYNLNPVTRRLRRATAFSKSDRLAMRTIVSWALVIAVYSHSRLTSGEFSTTTMTLAAAETRDRHEASTLRYLGHSEPAVSEEICTHSCSRPLSCRPSASY